MSDKVYAIWTLDHMESGAPHLHGIYSKIERARISLKAMAEIDAEFNEDYTLLWGGPDRYYILADPDDDRSTLEETYIEAEDFDKVL